RKLKKEKEAKEVQTRKEKIIIEKERIALEKATKKHLQKIEESIVKENGRIIIKTEEIHFDYSLCYLRRESRERLQSVIKTMKDNPGMVIEIATHTDIRGNSEYNRNLSQKRADAAKDFLVKNGIASNRVIAKGYGESAPIVKCEPETTCTEEDHEWNRRCELVIVRWN
ncbi:MAG: OmpA family protein, partial [Flavobacteriaceae bacterium]